MGNTNRSDTGLWHLTVKVSDHGVKAWLNLKDQPEEPPRVLAESAWPKERDGLTSRLENAVYDNPDVLDDYSATIIVETPRTLVVPPSEISEEGDAERIYSIAYKSRDEDLMIDDSGEETVLFTLAPGMISFLRRTFPGARVRSHLSLLIEKNRNQGTGLRIFIDSRKGEADIAAFNGPRLLSASVQPWGKWTDLAYRLFNLMEAYGLEPAQCEIIASGVSDSVFISLEDFMKDKCSNMRKL